MYTSNTNSRRKAIIPYTDVFVSTNHSTEALRSKGKQIEFKFVLNDDQNDRQIKMKEIQLQICNGGVSMKISGT